jgi:GntR family transcriptional regulator
MNCPALRGSVEEAHRPNIVNSPERLTLRPDSPDRKVRKKRNPAGQVSDNGVSLVEAQAVSSCRNMGGGRRPMSRSNSPVYLRVLEDLRMRIREGVLAPGARLPSRNAIIARYGVGETAAKHALQVLATEGLIEARAGSGSYVRQVPASRHLEHDQPHFPGSPFGLEESGPAGLPGEHARKVAWEHQTEQVAPPPAIARRLGATAATALVTMTRYLLTADGEPVQLATSYEPAGLTEGTAIALPEQGPLAGRGVIERMRVIGIEVDQVMEELSVRQSLVAEAAALALPPGATVLHVERVHLSGGEPVETADIIIPAGRFGLRYRFARPGQPA